jgi:hypothetical protein
MKGKGRYLYDKQWNVIFFVIPAASTQRFNGLEIQAGSGKSSKTSCSGCLCSLQSCNIYLGLVRVKPACFDTKKGLANTC